MFIYQVGEERNFSFLDREYVVRTVDDYVLLVTIGHQQKYQFPFFSWFTVGQIRVVLTYEPHSRNHIATVYYNDGRKSSHVLRERCGDCMTICNTKEVGGFKVVPVSAYIKQEEPMSETQQQKETNLILNKIDEFQKKYKQIEKWVTEITPHVKITYNKGQIFLTYYSIQRYLPIKTPMDELVTIIGAFLLEECVQVKKEDNPLKAKILKASDLLSEVADLLPGDKTLTTVIKKCTNCNSSKTHYCHGNTYYCRSCYKHFETMSDEEKVPDIVNSTSVPTGACVTCGKIVYSGQTHECQPQENPIIKKMKSMEIMKNRILTRLREIESLVCPRKLEYNSKDEKVFLVEDIDTGIRFNFEKTPEGKLKSPYYQILFIQDSIELHKPPGTTMETILELSEDQLYEQVGILLYEHGFVLKGESEAGPDLKRVLKETASILKMFTNEQIKEKRSTNLVKAKIGQIWQFDEYKFLIKEWGETTIIESYKDKIDGLEIINLTQEDLEILIDEDAGEVLSNFQVRNGVLGYSRVYNKPTKFYDCVGLNNWKTIARHVI